MGFVEVIIVLAIIGAACGLGYIWFKQEREDLED